MCQRDVPHTLFDRVLTGLALLCYVVGAGARLRYGLVDHPARHFAVVDAANMLEGTFRMVSGQQSRWDTIWPPGEMAFTALMGRFDATLATAGLVQVLLSLLVPWLAADVARCAAGRRAFWFGLLVASLHSGYVHHVGFFLSECMFQVSIAFAIWFTALAIDALRMPDTTAFSRISRSLFAGGAWALAALFRPNALPIAIALVAGFLALAVMARRWAYVGTAAAFVIGLSLVAAPAALRCTVLKGEFCPVSSNFAMNVALGQAGERTGLTFVAKDGSDFSGWSPPALLNRGYEGLDTVPAGIFDTRGVLSWVYERVRSDPRAALRNVARNAADTFRIRLWPGYFGPWSEDWFEWGSWALALVVLLPATFGSARVMTGLLRAPGSDPHGFMALVGVASVLVLAALSLGEGRYRYPFDLWWIVLAARLFTPAARVLRVRGLRRVWYRLALASVSLFALVLLFVAQPKNALGRYLAPDLDIPFGVEIHRMSDQLSRVLPARAPWNVGTVILACEPECAQLRVHFAVPQEARSLEMTVDHNDSYRVTFYRGMNALAHVELPIHRGGVGMFTHKKPIPKRAAGFDNLSVTPLYGDSFYSVGHVLLH